MIISFIIGGIVPLLASLIQKLKRTDFTKSELYADLSVAKIPSIFTLIGGILVLSVYSYPGLTEERHIFTLSGMEKIFAIEFDIFFSPLSKFFLLLIGFFACVTAIYSMGYLPRIAKSRHLDLINICYIPASFNFFILSMTMICVIDNIYLFILSWECMTITSSVFVFFKYHYLSLNEKSESDDQHHYSEEITLTRLAIKNYLIFGQISTALIFCGLALASVISGENSLSDIMDWLRCAKFVENVYPMTTHVIILLLLLGFGVKAALMPFGTWLPLINFSSPGNAHALHSSVMVKIGVFGIFYVFMNVYREYTWISPFLLLWGAISAFKSVCYAMSEHDLKKALAYHTVENVGLIVALIGLGGMAANAEEGMFVASLAVTASLFHLLNHSLFKGVLLLSTGSFDMSLKTTDMHKLRGILQHRGLSWMGIAFLCGSMAIAGLPPFNGLVSEWLMLLSFIKELLLSQKGYFVLIVVTGLVLICASFALCLFCFGKICSVILFGKPSQTWINEDEEIMPDPYMKSSVGILAFFCLLLGIFPEILSKAVYPILADIPDESINHASYLPRIILCIATVCALVYFFNQKKIMADEKDRIKAWNFGSEPLRVANPSASLFNYLVIPGVGLKRNNISEPTEPFALPDTIDLELGRQVTIRHLTVINSILKRLNDFSSKAGIIIQNGKIEQYLTYIFVSFIVMAGVMLLWK